jgi:hypothetical protein
MKIFGSAEDRRRGRLLLTSRIRSGASTCNLINPIRIAKENPDYSRSPGLLPIFVGKVYIFYYAGVIDISRTGNIERH